MREGWIVFCWLYLWRYSIQQSLSSFVRLDKLCYFCIFTVDLLLKAVGDTPIMKQKKWAVERGRTVQSLSQFISRFLKLDTSEQLVRIKIVWWFNKKIWSVEILPQVFEFCAYNFFIIFFPTVYLC